MIIYQTLWMFKQKLLSDWKHKAASQFYVSQQGNFSEQSQDIQFCPKQKHEGLWDALSISSSQHSNCKNYCDTRFRHEICSRAAAFLSLKASQNSSLKMKGFSNLVLLKSHAVMYKMAHKYSQQNYAALLRKFFSCIEQHTNWCAAYSQCYCPCRYHGCSCSYQKVVRFHAKLPPVFLWFAVKRSHSEAAKSVKIGG